MFLKKHLGAHKALIFLCSVLFVFQAVFSLSVPYLMGEMINVGIQQKGIESPVPEVIKARAVELFTQIVPDGDEKTFFSFYEKSEDGKVYNLREDYDEAEALRIYENTMTAGFYIITEITQGKTPDLEAEQINYMVERVSLRTLYLYSDELSAFSDEEILGFYEKAVNAPEALKNQLASLTVSYFYDDVGIDCEEIQQKYIFRTGAIMVFCVLMQVLCIALTGRIAARVSSSVTGKLREEYLLHTAEFSSKQKRVCDNDLYSVFSDDINNIGLVINFLMSAVFYAPIVSLGGIVLSFTISPFLSIVVLATVVVVVAVLFVIYRVALPKYDNLQKNYSLLVRFVKNGISRIYTIRTMRTQKLERARFADVTDKVKKDESYVLKAVFTGLSIVSLISNLVVAATVVLSGNSLLSSRIGIGDIIAFLQYSVISVSAFTAIAAVIMFAPRAKVSFKRFNEVMNTPIPERPNSQGIRLSENDGHTVEFRNVGLSFENGGLSDVTFTAKKGQITAIAAPTGCGKTTLLGLLTGSGENFDGEILVDSQDLREISIDSLRKRVSYAFSEPVLFSKSVKENLLLYGAEDNRDAVKNALESASVDFVTDENMILENSGNRLSGGQRGRLSLAGALSKKAGIYIIDDCMKSVDVQTEKNILKKLRKLSETSAVILVSQRINSLMEADNIVVFNKNGIEAQGTHTQLLETSDFYRELASLQGLEVSAYE
ncbi:MAG: ABC transporter ATP-binding protein [Clostridia bacterium]|nr:ABC transporter ATP-binding protein [Clostridia bacterium]